MTELTKKLADVQTKLKAKKSSYNSFVSTTSVKLKTSLKV